MKLIHISDLHIGKRVNEFSMLEDQKYILRQILSIAAEEQADGVLLAGDVYDKSVPPAEAVQVLDQFLTGFSEKKIPVFIVSGNHDSPERLAFGADLMRRGGVYFSPVYDGRTARFCLEDRYGEVWIHLLPFLKPAMVRHAAGEEADIRTCQEAVQYAVEHMDIDQSKRNILVAHQFVTGAMCCDSEEISVGGADQVGAAVFSPFDYTALGHIHSPQNVGSERVRYCGTPLKYSFSEIGQKKSITIVELKEKGSLTLREVPLHPLRDMRRLRGTYMELTSKATYEHTHTEDYLQVVLTDEEDIVDGLQKLRVIYPNLMRLEYDNTRTRQEGEFLDIQIQEKKSELEYLDDFFKFQNNQPMNEAQRKFAKSAIGRMKSREEESE